MLHALQESFLMERYWPGVTRSDVATTEENLWRAADDLNTRGCSDPDPELHLDPGR